MKRIVLALATSALLTSGAAAQDRVGYADLELDTINNNTIVPGGIVRIIMMSSTGNTVYVVEGSVIPVPAAAWLFGSALGLLAWVRRRVAVK